MPLGRNVEIPVLYEGHPAKIGDNVQNYKILGYTFIRVTGVRNYISTCITHYWKTTTYQVSCKILKGCSPLQRGFPLKPLLY